MEGIGYCYGYCNLCLNLYRSYTNCPRHLFFTESVISGHNQVQYSLPRVWTMPSYKVPATSHVPNLGRPKA
jgi:hypothetical protein